MYSGNETFLKFFYMLYSIEDRKILRKLNEIVSLQDQAKAVRLQDKLRKQNFHEDMKKVFEPVTKSLENASQDITKTITETSIENNQAIENINNKLPEIMTDRGILASYLMSPLSIMTKPENTTQFKLLKNAISNRVDALKINKSVPITLYNNLLTFLDTSGGFELKGDLLKLITNENYNEVLAKLSDKEFLHDFAKEVNFDLKAVSEYSNRDRTLIKLLESPGLMVSASCASKTIFSSSNPD